MCPAEHARAHLTPAPRPRHTKPASQKPGRPCVARPSPARLGSAQALPAKFAQPGRAEPEEVPDAAGRGAGGSGT